jgi:hypothetical protein
VFDMKSALARLGIRGFKPHLRKAPERLAGLQTPEGTNLPTNMIEEFRRDMARLALVREQISSIEKTRAERLKRAPDTEPHAGKPHVRFCAGGAMKIASLPLRATGRNRDETSLAPGKVQKRRMDDLKPFAAIQRVRRPPGKGEPASRKRVLQGWWQHRS